MKSAVQSFLNSLKEMTAYERTRLCIQMIQLVATILVPFVIIVVNNNLNNRSICVEKVYE